MKKLFLLCVYSLLSFSLFSQSPQAFQYQAVVRDVSGTALVNQSVSFKISIISGTLTGPVEYQETHTASTNAYGIVTLSIGTGIPVSGTFSSILWGTNQYFVKVEADPAGGTAFLDMGTTQLLSVPYALYSEKAGNIPVFTGGSGIDVTGTTITNTNPDQTISLTGTGATSVSGTYPNFTINSTDNNTAYTAGTGLSLSGTTFNSVWSVLGNNIYNNNSGNIGIGTTTPSNQLHIYNSLGASSARIGNTSTSFDNRLFFGDGSFVYIGEEIADDRLSIKAGTMSLYITSGGGSGTAGQVLKSNGTTVSWQNESTTSYLAGTGLSLTGNTFNASTTTALWNANQLQGRSISSTAPISGQFLGWNGTNWIPTTATATPGGLNKTIQFNNSGVFAGDTAMIWDNTNKRLGVGLTNPNGRMVVRGSATAPATEPLFEVKNALGQTVFVVYPDSVHIYVKDTGGAKSNQGGFAVSGRNNAKAFTNNFLSVTPDSTRIFTGDPTLGFGVENLGTGASTSYMLLTPDNYFIGHQAGDSNTTGIYNSFFGYQCGINNISGSYNVFSGYKSGYENIGGNYNTFIGYLSGQTNTSSDNTFIGYQTGKSHITGGGNVYLGSKAGMNDLNGVQNVFIGESAGESNNNGYSNIFLGYSSGKNNSNGAVNIMIGNSSGFSNTLGANNVFIGDEVGYSNISGHRNNFIGQQAGRSNTTGIENDFIGYRAGYKTTTGSGNQFIGMYTGLWNTIGEYNTFLGRNAGYWNDTGDYNVFIGPNAGFSNVFGNRLTLVGFNTDAFNDVTNSTVIGNSATVATSNKVRIGNSTVTVIEGQVAYTFPSDERFKNNITEDVKGLDFIKRLRPVVYEFDTRKFDSFLLKNAPDSIRNAKLNSIDYSKSSSIRQTGFIAQEVEQAAKESGFNFNGVHTPDNDNDNYSVAYSLFTVPLVKAVQEMDDKIILLQAKIDALQKENDYYKTRISEQDKKIELINSLLSK